jgi:hypothetical protein
MKSFIDYLTESGCTCWKGYKRKPGTKPCAEGSCVKEEAEQIEELSSLTHKNYGFKAALDGLTRIQNDKNDPKIEKRVNGIDRSNEKLKQKEVKEETELDEAAVDAKGYKSSTGGLTQKGRDAYNHKEGSHLKAPVTTPPSKLKKGSKAANRRKSFCARMSGVDGPMKKPNGEPTRKALALRKWNC